MTGYLPVVIYLGVIVAFAVGVARRRAGPQPAPPVSAKLESYECGAEPIGEAWVQFPVGFYLVALVFIVCDALAVFLFPWVLVLRDARRRRLAACSVPGDPHARMGLRVPRRDSRVEIKRPVPVSSRAGLAKLQGPSGVGRAAQDAA